MAWRTPVIIDEIFGELVLTGDERHWTVVRTKARCEKKLADHAQRNGIQYYLPLRESKKIYQKSKVTFTLPLFSGYLFVCVDVFQRQTLAISGFTAGFIRVRQEQQLLDELLALHKIPEKKKEAGPQYWLSKGLEVEIINGALAGTRGVVESHEKLSEVRLQVDILRQAVLVRIDPSDLKIIGEYEVLEEQ